MKSAGFSDKEDDEYIAAHQIIKNQQRFIAWALETDNKRGGTNDDKRAAA